jgi:DeoR family transcriptional regulator, fructose operon transcriptional repressor
MLYTRESDALFREDSVTTNDEDKIFLEERRNKILDRLKEQRRASVAELSQAFKIGEATIRRDLSDLEARGLVQRTHGGVLIMESVAVDHSMKERATQNLDAKTRIARFIAHFIHDNETLMMDAGSTTHLIAHMLKEKHGLVVVTNSPLVAEELVTGDGFQVISTGGELKEPTRALVGPVAEHTVRQFRVNRVILGMSALKADEGMFTVNQQEAEVKRAMIASGKEVIVAMDSSKIGKVNFSFVSDFAHVDKLVTDGLIPPEEMKRLEEQEVEVIVV